MNEFKQTIDAYINKVGRIFEKMETENELFRGQVTIQEHCVFVGENYIDVHIECNTNHQTITRIVDDVCGDSCYRFVVEDVNSFELIDWLYINIATIKTELCIKNARQALKKSWQIGKHDAEHDYQNVASELSFEHETSIGDYKIIGTVNEIKHYVEEDDKSYYMYDVLVPSASVYYNNTKIQ